MRGILVVALLASACSFTPGSFRSSTDAAPDGPATIRVGFANAANTTDEEAGIAQVRVILSEPSTEAISVSFAVTGGTANRPSDFLVNDGTLTFAPGDVEETIDITVGPDGEAEGDETIELTLTNPTGGAELAIDVHTLTISMNTLPRVTFSSGTSAEDETVSASGVTVVLDKASQLTTSVELAVMSGTATGGGTDYSLSTTTITFNPGETSIPVPLVVVDDKIDEDNETVTLELTTSTNIVVGTQSTTTHTINDEDAAPTVSFSTIGQRVNENIVSVDIAVNLSMESGKSISVPFAVDAASTATGGGTDYTVSTASPLTYAPGATTQNITVTINDDMLAEPTETVVLTLGSPTNATPLAPTTYTLSIGDNDSTCLGPDSTPFNVCFAAAPSNTVTINANLNTDSSPLCSGTAPLAGWTGQPDSCFVVGQTINVSGASAITGSRPLVLFATGNITISSSIDAASHRGGTTGPAANSSSCGTYTDAPAASSSGGGGGAGGTFRTIGGAGGQGNSAGGSGGSPIAVGSAPTTLRGGCQGQKGGNGSSANGADPGAGGGAIYMVAGGTITVNTGITINVSGAGADALSGAYGGGGGGGSGGMLVLVANAFSVTGAQFMANGGGGSRGGDNNDPGADGFDPLTSAPTSGGAGGTSGSGGGVGGRGFGTTTAVEAGGNGGSGNAGGGGGGGGGYISSSAALTGATVSAGQISP